jgi:hypothetical protein
MKTLILLLLPITAFAQGLRGTYFQGRGTCPSLPAELKVARLDPAIDFFSNGTMGSNFNTADAGVPVNNFTARWSGTYEALTAGTHSFELEHNDEVMLTIDGTVVLTRPGNRPASTIPVDVVLTAGDHIFELCYAHSTGGARIRLRHMPPGATAYAAIPPAQLFFDPPFRADAGSLDFDTMTPLTYVTNQLQASHGIVFSQMVGTNGFYYSRPRVVAAAPSSSVTAPNVLRNDSWDAVEGQPNSSNTPLRFSFTRAQSHVALAAGTQEESFPSPPAVLRAYNAAGQIIAADRVSQVATSITSRLHLLRGAADITAVTVDFGSVQRDERIDGLKFEAFALAPVVTDVTPPAIEFISPVNGSSVEMAAGFSVVVRVREAQSGIGNVELSTGTSTQVMGYDGTPEEGCMAPTCSRYRTSVTLPNGTHTLTVRASDGAGQIGTASATVGFTGVTQVLVVDEAGLPLSGAEVWVNDQLHPVMTPASGMISIFPPVAVGTQIVARQVTHEHNTYRGNHAQGGGDNWNFRVYRTSVAIGDDGTPGAFRVINSGVVQRLVLRNSNTLVGAHITASMNWHAGVQANNVRDRFLVMSDFLYNATDGQFFIERVDLADQGRDWGNVDMRIYANNSLRANVNWPLGGFLGNNLFSTSYMNLSYYDSGYTYAHEFGHYGLDLNDEYSDDDANTRCSALAEGGDPTFGLGRQRASCMMWDQGGAGKLCSSHAHNPHVRGTRQGDQSCWDHVVSRYAGIGGASFKTPTTRGAVPGNAGVAGPVVAQSGGPLVSMVPVVSSWRPKVVLDLTGGTLCPDFITRLTNPDGTPAVMVPVFVQLSTGGVVPQGLTDAEGKIRVIGAHPVDTVIANGIAASAFTDMRNMPLHSSRMRIGTPGCPPRAEDLQLATPVIARP